MKLTPRRQGRAHDPGLAQPRARWLAWLTRVYGTEQVGAWWDPPVSFEQWRAQHGTRER